MQMCDVQVPQGQDGKLLHPGAQASPTHRFTSQGLPGILPFPISQNSHRPPAVHVKTAQKERERGPVLKAGAAAGHVLGSGVHSQVCQLCTCQRSSNDMGDSGQHGPAQPRRLAPAARHQAWRAHEDPAVLAHHFRGPPAIPRIRSGPHHSQNALK